MAKTAYPTQSTSHIGRIRHRRNGAKPAKWATNAATKSPTVANTVERGIAPGRMRGERGAQDPDNATAFKCCPPIRDLHEQDALWAGLADGTLDGVVTDHSPASADMKAGTLAAAWGGVSSLQVGFRAVLTGAMRRGLSLADVVRWMSCNTARLVGLDDRGDITPVLRADLAIIRPYERFVVDATALESRNPICACDGMTLNGVVTRTFVAGRDALSGVREGNLIVRP